ncbi:MAG: hypothetical protein OEO23_08925, partial [Gemmatimonadota bacterium]|nr:hypothetical protein [Gemmatimonadota bacterium]
MRGLMTLVVASVLGAGAFGVFKGMQVKEQILDERRQAREDSIAAVALAISQAALADSSSSSESSLTGEQPDMPDSTAVEAVDRPDGDTPVAAGGGGGVQTPPGPEASGGESEVPEDPGPSREELAAAARQAAEARALALQTMDRLSKIFSEMKPGEAAEVLSFLS